MDDSVSFFVGMLMGVVIGVVSCCLIEQVNARENCEKKHAVYVNGKCIKYVEVE